MKKTTDASETEFSNLAWKRSGCVVESTDYLQISRSPISWLRLLAQNVQKLKPIRAGFEYLKEANGLHRRIFGEPLTLKAKLNYYSRVLNNDYILKIVVTHHLLRHIYIL